MERIFFFTYQQGQTQKDSQIKGKSTTKLIFIHSAGKYDQDVKTLFLVLSTSSASLFTSCHLLLLYPKRGEKKHAAVLQQIKYLYLQICMQMLTGAKKGERALLSPHMDGYFFPPT